MASSPTERMFLRQKSIYYKKKKKNLEELVEKLKKEYDEEVKTMDGKTRYDYKTKKHVPIKPKQDFSVAALRKFYTDL